ncbi:MAG: hypothetical protein OXI80_14500 [Caldilineaceae bacterium]|nr:hypothetical protein [Caldilineaceae bacterium]MDE0338877.1 hypothetical protein [Caldilineaceae bacterium]
MSVRQTMAFLRKLSDDAHDLHYLYVPDGGDTGHMGYGPGWVGMSWSRLAMN